jgi:hypothetical protein
MLDELLHGVELADKAIAQAESMPAGPGGASESKDKLVGEIVEIKQLLLKVSREITAELK